MSIEAVLTVQLNRKSQNGMAVYLCKIRLIIEWELGTGSINPCTTAWFIGFPAGPEATIIKCKN
jgi:hypothetical protein